MRPLRALASFAVIAAIGAGAFFSVRLLMDGFFAEAQDSDTVITPQEDIFDRERQEPRFAGDILGIFIGPSDSPAPSQYVTHDDVCPPGATTVEVPREQAGVLDLRLDLPGEFVLQDDSVNTGVIACDGAVYAARWHYLYKSASGMTADIVIGRTLFNHWDGWDVAASRVHATVIAGRDAVVIEPVTPDGLASRSGVAFPEPFGMTFISAANLSSDELHRLAERVARAHQ